MKDLDLHDFSINQNFPRFFPTCYALGKAREILTYKIKRAQCSELNNDSFHAVLVLSCGPAKSLLKTLLDFEIKAP